MARPLAEFCKRGHPMAETRRGRYGCYRCHQDRNLLYQRQLRSEAGAHERLRRRRFVEAEPYTRVLLALHASGFDFATLSEATGIPVTQLRRMTFGDFRMIHVNFAIALRQVLRLLPSEAA